MWKSFLFLIAMLLCAGLMVLWAGRYMVAHRPATAQCPPGERVATDNANDSAVTAMVQLLQPGDVVLRMGLGADSYLLSLANKRDKRFSHCGIVFFEDGRPVVYHSIGGEDNPDARLRRDEVRGFFSPFHNTAIGVARYAFDSAQRDSLYRVVRRYYRAAPKFDLKFDLATDTALYCTEFVYKALCRAAADTAYIGTSILRGQRYAGVDDLYLNRHARLVHQIKFKQYLCPTK